MAYVHRKISIEFEGADQVTDVWINGMHLTKHVGVYLPFSGDITDYVEQCDAENVNVAKGDNHESKAIHFFLQPGQICWPDIFRVVPANGRNLSGVRKSMIRPSSKQESM